MIKHRTLTALLLFVYGKKIFCQRKQIMKLLENGDEFKGYIPFETFQEEEYVFQTTPIPVQMEQKSFYSRNKSPKFIQIYHHYSSYSTLWGRIDEIDGILFQFYLFSQNVALHLLFLYSNYSCSQKLSNGMQSY